MAAVETTCPSCAAPVVGEFCGYCGNSCAVSLDEAEYLYDEQEYLTRVLEGR